MAGLVSGGERRGYACLHADLHMVVVVVVLYDSVDIRVKSTSGSSRW